LLGENKRRVSLPRIVEEEKRVEPKKKKTQPRNKTREAVRILQKPAFAKKGRAFRHYPPNLLLMVDASLNMRDNSTWKQRGQYQMERDFTGEKGGCVILGL